MLRQAKILQQFFKIIEIINYDVEIFKKEQVNT